MTTTASPKTVIVDYGTGNLNSLRRILGRIGCEVVVSGMAGDILNADNLILPGVGHFGTAMEVLRQSQLTDALDEAVLVKRKPVLGICLGMELMAETSEEGNSPGLGWIRAEAVRFQLNGEKRYKVPHMGWNDIAVKKNSVLMTDIDETAEFYFAHSYHLRIHDTADLLAETGYGVDFPSAIEKDNMFAVQFHPEKSHDAGTQLLKNFVQL